MKKLMLALTLLLLACNSPTEPETVNYLLYGDVQGDGLIDVFDYDLLHAVTTGSAVTPLALIQACGDVDNDKQITVLDAYYVRAYIEGMPAGRVGKPCIY